MLLLNTSTKKVVDHSRLPPGQKHGPLTYAILSHRWRMPEIILPDLKLTYPAYESQLSLTDLPASVSRDKLIAACDLARSNKGRSIEWLWADNVCIDKSDPAERTQALNSMFEYYNQAEICIAYLDDVDIKTGIGQSTRKERAGLCSEWFTRGWTLQELLAPQELYFFDQNWTVMGTRHDLAHELAKPNITGIATGYLAEPEDKRRLNLHHASRAAIFSWMAGRITGEVEDIAYSLIGLLGINLTPQYGEGTAAFARLQQEILKSHLFDESLFAWKMPLDGMLACFQSQWTGISDHTWGLLAPSPDCFKDTGSYHKHDISPRNNGGFRWSYAGMTIELPWKQTRNLMGLEKKAVTLPLNCSQGDERNPLTAQIELAKDKKSGSWQRIQCHRLEPKAGAKKIDAKSMGIDQGPGAYTSMTIAQPNPQLTRLKAPEQATQAVPKVGRRF